MELELKESRIRFYFCEESKISVLVDTWVLSAIYDWLWNTPLFVVRSAVGITE